MSGSALSPKRVIPYGRQDITDDDVAAVEAVLRSDFLTTGPMVPAFEAEIRAATGADHAVAVNSATSALHIACLALGLGPGDWLWTSPNSFVASANCGLYCGAKVDFVDVGPATWNMCAVKLAEKLEATPAEKHPKVVVPVAFGGRCADLAAIRILADRYGFFVLEDASHAIGGEYMGRAVGAGTYADISVFSFHPVKIVTTAEGGACVTNSAKLAEKMQLYRSHGVTRDERLMRGESDGPWYYQQVDLGLNYRMTDLQAALGISQMKRISAFIKRRRALVARYDAALLDLPVQCPVGDDDSSQSAWHLYPIMVEASVRRRVFEGMRAAGVLVNVHYIPIHTQPYYREMGFQPGDFPEAERYYAGAISLPMFPALTDTDQDYVIETLAGLLA
ncbi:MAG: UDP-4-amino-4,6-dideoxy-N-acetyl-beta-L-altrosamine transaminase [Pikeienuella sp.]